jgi:5-methylcytosine-specific restriction endonuclease McrA
MENTKVCSDCLVAKDRSEFTPTKKNTDGLMGYCKVCRNEKTRKRYKENIEVERKRHRDYTLNMPDEVREKRKRKKKEIYERNKEERKAYSKEYNKKNKQKIVKQGKDRYERRKEELRKLNKLWKINNKSKITEYGIKLRTRLTKNGIFQISEKEIKRLLSKPCYPCNKNPSEHLDHIVPLCRGGRHSIGNLLGACQKCNLSKSKKLLYEYKAQRRKEFSPTT